MEINNEIYLKEIENSYQLFLSIVNDEQNWKEIGEKLQVKVFQKFLNNSDIGIIKGEGIIKEEPKKIKELLLNMEQRQKWDIFFDNGHIVKEIEKDKVIYKKNYF